MTQDTHLRRHTSASIRATRGQTIYEFVVDADSADDVLVEAAKCEKWINEQPDRLQAEDRESNMRRA